MKLPAIVCPLLWRGLFNSYELRSLFFLLFTGLSLSSCFTPVYGLTLVQQGFEVTGQVTDASNGEPLPGVNIIIEGRSTGDVTDGNGNFNITVPDERTVLVFSYVGYSTKSEIVGNQRIINLSLVLEAQEMDELVVIGYGTVKKSDLTGAISSVKAADIEKAGPVNIESALQGRAAGVYVSQNSGAPGTDPVVRIRGIGTINAHAPIYVIDGIIMDISDYRNEANTLNFLNPADIASIEVLKDASASAIYGSRGANGVVLITTHKGFDSRPKVTFSARLGFAKAAKLPEVLGSDDYVDLVNTAYLNMYLSDSLADPGADLDTIFDEVRRVNEQYLLGYDTDWYDEITKDAPALSQDYNFSVRGGSEDALYSASFGYYDEEGILVGPSNYRRYAFRVNTDFKLGKIFRVGENFAVTQSKRNSYEESEFDYEMKGEYARGVNWARRTAPIYPVYLPDSLLDPYDPNYEYTKYDDIGEGHGANPVYMLHERDLDIENLTLFGNAFVEARFLNDLVFRSSLGLNYASSFQDEFWPKFYDPNTGEANDGGVVNRFNRTNGWLWENTISYQKVLEKHSIQAMAGYTSEHNKYDYLTGRKVNVANNDEEMRTLNATLSNPETSGDYDVVNMLSMLARLHYGYDNRYLLTASVRRDGTSKFGPEDKWGLFPSAAISWNIGNESFLDRVNRDILRVLKLRASWGQIGNTSMAPNYSNAYVSQLASDYRLRALVDNQPHNSYYFTTIGNPDLSWETTEQINFGLDLGMFKNAFFLTADYFIKSTEDMLMISTVPGYSGYPAFSQPVVNAGTVQNRGFELELVYKGASGYFSYDLSANFTCYRNEVTALHGGKDIQYLSPNRSAVGHPIGMFYGFVTDGIFQTEEEVQGYVDSTGVLIQSDAVPGDFRFKDLNGDGIITNDGDRTFIGNPHPDFMYGFTVNLRYRGFDLMTFWQGVYGNDIWNLSRDYDFDYGIKNTYKHIYDEAWRGEGTSDEQPRITRFAENNNFKDSDYFLEDGSYLRMKNLQIGYTLPESVSQKLHITNCRLWIGGTDLLTFTSYSGIDPEIGLVHPQYSGLGNADTYPKYRKLMVGIHVEF